MSERDDYDPNATNPMGSAQANMRPGVLKRFFAQVSVVETDGGFALKLDGRGARTPGKAPLVAPRRAIADMIAAEWAGQGEILEPWTMLATRLANSAIDGVAHTMAETRADIARYAGSDLICYRADEPDDLVALQISAHEPVLHWVRDALGAHFRVAAGVMHVQQPAQAIAAVEAEIGRHADPFAVAALHGLTSLSGSVLLSMMLARGAIAPADAWRLAHVEEDFQIQKWGEDHEAAQRRQAREREFATAAKIILAL